MKRETCFPSQSGFTLLEALIAVVIVAFGLLGLAGLQMKIQVSETDSYQRAQALLLVQNMSNRISANRSNAASYLTGNASLGTSDTQPTNCTTLNGAARDKCEWSKALKGAAEKASSTQANIGAMTGARGCVQQAGTNPTVYRVSVAWQGLTKFNAPSLSCGQGSYGDDGYRRAVSQLIPIANLSAT